MDCSIIIISYNVCDMLVACLESVLAQPVNIGSQKDQRYACEILVVDSASTDASVATITQRFPQVQLLPQTENIGFVRGNNLALAQAQGRYLFLLNPDTLLLPDALPTMLAYLDTHPDVGIVGPRTLNSDMTYQSTRRRFPTRALAFFESTWVQSVAPRQWLDQYYVRDASEHLTLDVDWVQGSAMLVRHAVYDQIGGLDAAYQMYSEELDWCRRARDAGWRVVYLADAAIIHYGGASSEQVGANKHIWFQQSKLHYFERYHGRNFARLLRLWILALYAWQFILEATKSLLGNQAALRRARMETYRAVLTHGLPL